MTDRSAPGRVLPVVSVVMPVRNEAAHIERTLRSVLDQDYPAELTEVIVADGLSEDATTELISAVTGERTAAHPRVTVVRNDRRTTPAGLNAAIAVAGGEVIVRVDGHCMLEPDYIRRCVDVLLETGADNVGGVQRAVGRGIVGRAIACATSSPFGVGNARFRYATRRETVDTVYLGAYRREVFDRIGTFDEELTNNQDDELNLRLVRSGGRIVLDPSIRVRYVARGSIPALWRQYFRYGLYKVRVMQKAGGFTALRHYVPATFVIAVVAAALLSIAVGRPALALAIPAVYLVAVTCAAIWTGRRDLIAVPAIAASFVTVHVAYGIGFLAGVWKWRGRFGDRGAELPSRPHS